MGYRGRGYLRNQDMEVDASGAPRGQFIWTRRGDDEVTGSDHRDFIFTGSGNDTVEGGGGNDVMFGGRGTDTAIFSGSVLDYNVLSFGCGRWNLVQGADGCDFLHSFEVLQFDDFTLDLRANNDPLVVLRDDGLETSQGETLSFQVDFYDIDGSSVELVSASVTGGGTLTTQNSGVSQVGQMGVGGGTTVSFDPGNAYDSLGAGESTTETVTLVISDGQGGTTTVTYEITIEGQNDAPLALAVSATATEDAAIVVAADYSDIDTNDTHSFTIDTAGTLGTVTNNGDGTFSYDPTAAFESLAAGESATDTFTYTVDDGNGGTSTETVTITIQGQNDAPVAMAVSDTSDGDGPIITVSADYLDVDASDTHTFSVDTTDTLGTVTNNGDGTFDYDPNGAFESLAVGETATDTFTYTVDDGNGGTATETVTILVEGQNDAPVALAVSGNVSEDGPAVTVTADFSDADTPDTHTFSVDTTGTLGTVTNNGDGTFDYDTNGAFESLAVGETATDTFTYTVDDGNGGTDTETVTVTVTGENDAPVVTSTAQSASVRSAITLADQLDAADLFALYDGTPGAATLETVGGLEALRVGPQAIGRVPHTTIELFGAGELSADDTITIDLSSQNTRTGGDQDTFIGLTDGVRYIALFTTDQRGALLVTDFIEGAGNLGDGFPVIPTVTDRTIASLSQRVDNFDVQFTLDGANDQLALLAGGAGTGNIISAPILNTIGDWLDPSLGLSLILSNDGASETFFYNSIEYDVQVEACNTSGQIVFDDVDVSDTQSASVTQVALSGTVGTLVAADVQALLGLTTSSSASATGGTVDWTFPAPGSLFDYLADGEELEIAYTVTIDDGNGGATDEVVTITVEGTNDAPVAAAVSANANEDGPAITIAVDVTDADVSDTHTYTVDTTGTLGSVVNNGDGTFGYSAAGAFEDLAAGETATDTFTYTADDGNGGTSTETVTVTITGQNDAPVAEAVVGTVAEDPASFSSASIGGYIIPNLGRFYVYDFDTGTAVSIARDTGANNTYDQMAAAHLSNGNGIVMQANPNNEGWGFAALTYVDGVGAFVQASNLDVTGGNGAVDRSNGDWIAFGDSNQNIESIAFDVVGLELSNGTTVDAQVSIGPLDYEAFRTDDLRVDGAQFSSAINGPSPSVTVSADFADLDSDTFVFSVDDTGTVGSVVNNGDGTFTYSADGMFEHLNSGETATDSFAYTVDDGDGGLDTEIVTINISGSDDFLFA
ncbi:MAG: VCBS domain-containing protein [Shimia sp.]|uniref:VCBS domain-containing protein n=1 Tax=Shimia sp. TaxID=1954381 RepID=UPI001B2BF25B|nr:Ig-like domain-containing protein [Shimia sp.]MBO6895905.1 VCBS domain-containing protein [Shimia sp.]